MHRRRACSTDGTLNINSTMFWQRLGLQGWDKDKQGSIVCLISCPLTRKSHIGIATTTTIPPRCLGNHVPALVAPTSTISGTRTCQQCPCLIQAHLHSHRLANTVFDLFNIHVIGTRLDKCSRNILNCLHARVIKGNSKTLKFHILQVMVVVTLRVCEADIDFVVVVIVILGIVRAHDE